MLCPAASFNMVGKADLPRNNNTVQQSNEKVSGKYCGNADREEKTVWKRESLAEMATHLGI